MNKKFLSAILFGALMVTSTGTFVSCKDYDDDIESINKELTDIKSQIAALQNKVDAGNYVTNITKAENGINVAFSNGTTSFVETAAKVEVEKAETATIVGGEWVITKVDGSKVETGIPASGILVTGDDKKGYVLSIANAEGEITEVKLPTAASSLTDLIVITDYKELAFANYEYTATVKKADWKGPRTLPATNVGDVVNILASVESPVVQLNPTTVDGEAIEFGLVDSKNNVPSYITLKAKAFTELLTAGTPEARTANANGLYSLSLEEVVIPEKYEEFEAQFTKDGAEKLYAITAGNVRSEYEVIVGKGDNVTLEMIGIKDAKGNFVKAYNGNDCQLSLGKELGSSVSNAGAKVNVGEWYNVVATKGAEGLYDMHLSANADDVTLFGIEFKEEAGSYQFRMTKTPDNITKAGFKLTVETVAMDGTNNKTYIWVGQTRIVSDAATYDAIEHELKTDASEKNFFSIDLAKMKDAMSAESLALWNKNVANANVTFLNDEGKAVADAAGVELIFVKALKAKISECNEQEVAIASAKNIVFNVKNAEIAGFKLNKQYTAVITFVDAANEELNTIKVPFTFTLPAITTLFEIDPGFVKEGVANLYLYAADAQAVHKDVSATFMLDRVFSKYEAGFNIALEDKTKVGDTDQTSAQLAHMNSQKSDTKNATNVTIKEETLAYVTLTGDLGKEAGYGQVLNFIISGKFDGVWAYPEEDVFTFQAKVLSPFKEGKISPKEGAAVTIKASDLNGYKFGNSVIIGNTYNSEVTYKVLQDALTEDKTAGAWSRNDISAVAAKTGNDKYFVVKETVGAQPVKTDGVVTGLTEGYFLLEGYQVDHTVETTITVSVTDIWNRTLSSEVPVKITVAE